MATKKSTQTDSLHTDKDEEAYLLYDMVRHPLNLVSLKHNQKKGTTPRFSALVNHTIFNEQNLKTENFLFIHEKNIYTKQLELLVLDLIRKCSVELKAEEEVNEPIKLDSEFYKNSEIELQAVIQKYIIEKIETSPTKETTNLDFMRSVEPILLPNKFDFLNKVLKQKQTLQPVLSWLKFNDPDILTRKKFLKDLDSFIAHCPMRDSLWFFYQSPAVQKLASVFSGFSQEKLNLLLSHYCFLVNKNPDILLEKEEISCALMNEFSISYKKQELITNPAPFEGWGYYLIASPTFKTLDDVEKKDLIYTILKIYSPKHTEYSNFDPFLLKACCELYEKSPELLEYRSISVILELLKTNEIEHNQNLIAKIKPLIPLIPDIPSIDKHDSVQAMLHKEGYNSHLSVYNSLMPAFEAVMVRNILSNTVSFNHQSRKAHKV